MRRDSSSLRREFQSCLILNSLLVFPERVKMKVFAEKLKISLKNKPFLSLKISLSSKCPLQKILKKILKNSEINLSWFYISGSQCFVQWPTRAVRKRVYPSTKNSFLVQKYYSQYKISFPVLHCNKHF